jgi:WD40 repeat protein
MKASMIGALLEGGAEKPQVPVMETRKLKLGGDHPDTLTSMNNLAEKMYQRGQGYRSTTQSEHSTVASTLATYADRTQIVSAELQLSNQYMDLHQASVDPTHNGKFSLLPPFPHATKHTSCIYSMALTKNHLITASRDQTLIIWDLESYQPTNILRGHTGSVLSVCTSEALEEKILIYSGGVDGSVICWDLENGSLIREIKALHDDSVLHIAINDEYLFTSSKDKKIKVWHRHSWFASSAQNWRTRLFPTPVTVLTAHSAAVNCVTLTPHQLITGSGDRSIHIWKLGVPWRCVKTILHNKKGVASVAVSKNGRKIVSGSSDYTVRIFDTETGEEDACLLGHEGLVRCVIILPAADTTGAADDDDMDAIVSTGYDGRTILWRKQNEGGWVQAGSFDIKEAFKMYKKSEGKYLNNYSTRCFSVRSDGNRVFISSQLPSVAIWQLP